MSTQSLYAIPVQATAPSPTHDLVGLPRPRPASTTEAVAPDSPTYSRALVADPDFAGRDALAETLRDNGLTTVDRASQPAEVVNALAANPGGDLLLLSLGYGHQSLDLIAAAKENGWSRTIAMAPTADIGPVVDAVGAGAHGVLIAQRANPAAASVPAAVHELSAREVEVLQLVADGRSNKWIGDQLSLSALTVKSHLARIGRKLGTGDRAHMVALALRAGVIN